MRYNRKYLKTIVFKKIHKIRLNGKIYVLGQIKQTNKMQKIQ